MGRLIRPLLSGVLVALLATVVMAPEEVLADEGPMLSMTWNPTTIAVGQTSTLTLTPSNPDPNWAAVDVQFTDTLPAGLTVPNGAWIDPICSGTVRVTGNNNIAYSLATLNPTRQCPLAFTVTATGPGTFVNTTGPITELGIGTNTASATLEVTAEMPPTLAIAFGAASIGLGSSTSLTFTITNPNLFAGQTGIGFSDSLPAGLVVATPNGSGGDCGGTIAAVAGGGTVSLAGLSLDAADSCSFSVNVKGTSSGVKNNITDPISSAEGGMGNTANATVTVRMPPTLSMSFDPSTIDRNSTTFLSFTVTNPGTNASPLVGLSFSDTLPAGLTVANGSAAVCSGGGTVVTSDGNTIAVSITSLAIGESCTFALAVSGPSTYGSFTTTTGSVESASGVAGPPASTTLVVSAGATPTPTPNPSASPSPTPRGPATPLPTPPSTSSRSGATPSGSYPLPLLLLGLGLAFVVIRRCQLRNR